jgi:hypothetical protein
LAIGAHFFQTLGVRRANEISLHVIDASLRIHQVLIFFSFNLDHSHNDSINHIHRLAFVVFTLATFWIVFNLFTVLVHVTLDALDAVFFLEDPILLRGTSLVEAIDLLVVVQAAIDGVHLLAVVRSRLKIHIVQRVIAIVYIVEAAFALLLIILRVQMVSYRLMVLIILEVINVAATPMQVSLARLCIQSLNLILQSFVQKDGI